MITPRLNLPKPKTFEWDGRTWCTTHRDTCLSAGGGSVRPCPHCEDGAA